MVDDGLALKSISKEGLQRAIERAKHYRLLNDPEQAESICRDVLEVDPDNQETLIVLVLALTDQLGQGASEKEAQATAGRLHDPYMRAYYGGLISERKARSFLASTMSRRFAYDAFREAMARYEEAEKLRPTGNDDPVLRWNSCLRTIRSKNLRPPARDEREVMLE